MTEKIRVVDLDSGLKILSEGDIDHILDSQHLDEIEKKVRKLLGVEKEEDKSEAKKFLFSEKKKDDKENTCIAIGDHNLNEYKAKDAVEDLNEKTRLVCIFNEGEIDRLYIAKTLPAKESNTIDEIYLLATDYFSLKGAKGVPSTYEDYLEAYLFENIDVKKARSLALTAAMTDDHSEGFDDHVQVIFSTLEPQQEVYRMAINVIDTSKRKTLKEA